MKTANTLNLNEQLPLEEQLRLLQVQLNKLFQLSNGRVSFGTGATGINGQNVSGQWVTFTSNGTKDTEFAVPHTIGSIPIGYIVMTQDVAGTLYQNSSTGTAWTTTNIYLKCNVASVTFSVFLVKKGSVV